MVVGTKPCLACFERLFLQMHGFVRAPGGLYLSGEAAREISVSGCSEPSCNSLALSVSSCKRTASVVWPAAP